MRYAERLTHGQDFIDAKTELSFRIVRIDEAESLVLAEAMMDGGSITATGTGGRRVSPLLKGTRVFFRLDEVANAVHQENKAVEKTLARWRTGASHNAH